MNYYFFPQITSLKTTVTLANFPPTVTPSWDAQPAYIHATFSTGTKWKIFFIREIAQGDMFSFEVEDLPEQPPEESSVFLFMNPNRLPEYMDLLPIEKFMESEPNWRGNIKLSSETTSTSYQGEYPDFMLNLSKGTLLTFNPLIQTQSGVITQLIVVNILRNPEIREGRLFIVHQVSGKLRKECRITTNTCNLIDLSGLEDDFQDPLCLYSPDMVGVPLFLSHDSSFNFMSLEHSYPLHEVTVFGDNARRHGLLKKVKTYWINSIGENATH
jgi:hypothetical protein